MLHRIVGKDFLNKTKDPSVKGNNIPWDSIKSKYFYVSMAKGSVKRPHPWGDRVCKPSTRHEVNTQPAEEVPTSSKKTKAPLLKCRKGQIENEPKRAEDMTQ